MLMTEAMVLACGLAASGGPLAGQEVIELTGEDRILDAGFEELYRVGSLHGGDWDTFGSVQAVAFDGAGNLYVLDTQASRVSVVNLSGGLVRQFGQEGEGPGGSDGVRAPARGRRAPRRWRGLHGFLGLRDQGDNVLR